MKLYPWHCPCGNIVLLEKEYLKRRKVCSRLCPARACLSGNSGEGGRACQKARIARVMFAYGCTEESALWFIRGWRRGAQAHSYRLRRARLRKVGKSSGPRVGSSQWEARA